MGVLLILLFSALGAWPVEGASTLFEYCAEELAEYATIVHGSLENGPGFENGDLANADNIDPVAQALAHYQLAIDRLQELEANVQMLDLIREEDDDEISMAEWRAIVAAEPSHIMAA